MSKLTFWHNKYRVCGLGAQAHTAPPPTQGRLQWGLIAQQRVALLYRLVQLLRGWGGGDRARQAGKAKTQRKFHQTPKWGDLSFLKLFAHPTLFHWRSRFLTTDNYVGCQLWLTPKNGPSWCWYERHLTVGIPFVCGVPLMGWNTRIAPFWGDILANVWQAGTFLFSNRSV